LQTAGFLRETAPAADLEGVSVPGESIDSRPARRLLIAAAVLGALLFAIAGCGGGGSSSGGTTSGSTTGEAEAEPKQAVATKEAPATTGEIEVDWQRPVGQANVVGYELLKASETRYLAKSLATAFELPDALKIKGVNGFGGGPFYNPEDNSITLPYQFATAVLGVISQVSPEATETEWGEAVGAVNSFIFAHEFGHALIHNFELPVLGREEDAADGIATVLLLKAPDGATYAADAAEFWDAFSGRQNPPKLAEYADNHSFDRQRAFNILCWVGGSDENILQALAENEIVPEERLVSCPAEWQLLEKSAEQVLDPHLAHGVDLTPAD
jgi:Putative metallopeptidase